MSERASAGHTHEEMVTMDDLGPAWILAEDEDEDLAEDEDEDEEVFDDIPRVVQCPACGEPVDVICDECNGCEECCECKE